MPRLRNPNPPVRIHINLAPDLAARLAIECYNFAGTNSTHGMRGRIINEALRRYFKEEDSKRQTMLEEE